MLTSDEKDRVQALVLGLASAPDPVEPSLMVFMAQLPPRAEALDLARAELARAAPPLVDELDRVVVRLRELLSAPRTSSAALPSSLEVLLGAPGPHAPKVDALLALVRAGDRTAVPAIKARLPVETDPFVLATLASALGQLGERQDAPLLLPLLDSRDARVVANALDALNRMEAEAPVAQVRELVHAADHRLRLSALSLFARTDPVSALLVLPPLIAEKHPTLTGGIALLLGDLFAQPLATDLLLELMVAEDRPQILKHIAEALKRHATESPDRVPEMVERLTQTRAGARLHKVPVVTGLLESLGVTDLPPVFEPPAPERKPSGRVPTPAAAVAAATAAQASIDALAADAPVVSQSRIQTRPPGLVTPAYQSGMWKKGSGSIQRPPELALPVEPVADTPAEARPWMWLGGAVFTLVALFAFVGGPTPARTSTRTPDPATTSRSAELRSGHAAAPQPAVAPRASDGTGPLGRPAPRTLGPAGDDLTVEGTVVSVAVQRVVVRAGDNFYSCRGKGLTELKVGDPVRLRGRLAGVARDGMVLVTVENA